MKYFLVIGIEYKFFQKPGDITIHLGDKFIDTFQLDRDYPCSTNILSHIESRWYEKCSMSHVLTRADWLDEWKKVPSLFKVYELDDSVIEGKLKIKVMNSHSDHTNGFMKNSSMIKFPVVSIFQKDLTKNRGEKWLEALLELNNAINPPKVIPPHLREQKWYNADVLHIERENEIYQKSGPSSNYWWIGGSFTAEYMIKTKHRTKYVGLPEDSEWIADPRNATANDLVLASCKQLLNIYDEDQRSHI